MTIETMLDRQVVSTCLFTRAVKKVRNSKEDGNIWDTKTIRNILVNGSYYRVIDD